MRGWGPWEVFRPSLHPSATGPRCNGQMYSHTGRTIVRKGRAPSLRYPVCPRLGRLSGSLGVKSLEGGKDAIQRSGSVASTRFR